MIEKLVRPHEVALEALRPAEGDGRAPKPLAHPVHGDREVAPVACHRAALVHFAEEVRLHALVPAKIADADAEEAHGRARLPERVDELLRGGDKQVLIVGGVG